VEELSSASLTLDSTRPYLRPKDLRVVCDTMLQGLGRQLRLCGVDVSILDSGQPHDDAARIAMEEDRIILTCGKTVEMLSKHVPPGHCLQIENTQAKLQCLQVMHHFNVRVTSSDIFSRCQVCNCDQWTILPALVVYHLWTSLLDEALRKKGRRDDDDDVNENHNTSAIDALRNSSYEEATTQATSLGVSMEYGTFLSPLSGHTFKIDLTPIPELVFESVDRFYLCSQCAKLYWDGSHYRRTNCIYAEVLGYDICKGTSGLKISNQEET